MGVFSFISEYDYSSAASFYYVWHTTRIANLTMYYKVFLCSKLLIQRHLYSNNITV